MKNYKDENGIKIELKNHMPTAITIEKGKKIAELKNGNESILKINEIDNEEPPEFKGDETMHDLEGSEINISNKLNLEQHKRALEMIHKYRDVFSNKIEKLGTAKSEPYIIPLLDTIPVVKKP